MKNLKHKREKHNRYTKTFHGKECYFDTIKLDIVIEHNIVYFWKEHSESKDINDLKYFRK